VGLYTNQVQNPALLQKSNQGAIRLTRRDTSRAGIRRRYTAYWMEELPWAVRAARCAGKPADAVPPQISSLTMAEHPESSISQKKDGPEGVNNIASSTLFDLSAEKVQDTGVWIPHEICIQRERWSLSNGMLQGSWSQSA